MDLKAQIVAALAFAGTALGNILILSQMSDVFYPIPYGMEWSYVFFCAGFEVISILGAAAASKMLRRWSHRVEFLLGSSIFALIIVCVVVQTDCSQVYRAEGFDFATQPWWAVAMRWFGASAPVAGTVGFFLMALFPWMFEEDVFEPARLAR